MRRLNLWLGGLFALQAIAILILSANRPFMVTTNFLGVDTLLSQAQGHTVLALGTRNLFDLNLAYVVAAVLLVSAVTHVLVATKLRGFYEKNLKKSQNVIRWIELALVGGLALVAIGMLVGVQDVSTLILLFGLMAVSSLLGIIMETQNQASQLSHWVTCAISCLAGALPWLAVVIYAVSDHLYGAGVPAHVTWLIGSVFVLMLLIVANACVSMRKLGHWADYMHAEFVYLILIFVMESAFAWQIFAGSLRP